MNAAQKGPPEGSQSCCRDFVNTLAAACPAMTTAAKGGDRKEADYNGAALLLTPVRHKTKAATPMIIMAEVEETVVTAATSAL